jgi:hypothetical protein
VGQSVHLFAVLGLNRVFRNMKCREVKIVYFVFHRLEWRKRMESVRDMKDDLSQFR